MDETLTQKLDRIKREAQEREAQHHATALGKKYITLSKTPINIEALSLIPEETARAAGIAGIERKVNKIAVVALDPSRSATKKVIDDLTAKGYEITDYIVSRVSLDYALSYYRYVAKETEKITGKVQIEQRIMELADRLNSIAGLKEVLTQEALTPSKAGEILEIISRGAMGTRASDIHLEPTEHDGKLRLRIDGNLHDIFTFTKEFYPYLLTRIKLLSNLKLNVTREAQDGRFTIRFPSKDVEVRVAIAPAQFGEVAVMRLLDPDAIKITLPQLGLREDDLAIINVELARPNGMILNTGPTGSGKTTTLYTFLGAKANPEEKIITIEDPIEYHLEGIEQTQINNAAGYTFANGLRSLMRQDPDIILVGEIRDQETAEIAIQAALTGHLVFSTLHTNSAAGAIPRLLDLNVKPQSIGPALTLVIAQRLVRRLCTECKTPLPLDDDLAKKFKTFVDSLPARVNRDSYKMPTLFTPVGCDVCNNTGYKGRVAIYELFTKQPGLENLIASMAGEETFLKFAREHGMTTMQEDGILKVIAGMTTFDEVEGVTGPIEWPTDTKNEI
jgi:type IV pilus assembly protein PilB